MDLGNKKRDQQRGPRVSPGSGDERVGWVHTDVSVMCDSEHRMEGSGTPVCWASLRKCSHTDSWLVGSGPFTTVGRHDLVYSRSHSEEAAVKPPGSRGLSEQRSGRAVS